MHRPITIISLLTVTVTIMASCGQLKDASDNPKHVITVVENERYVVIESDPYAELIDPKAETYHPEDKEIAEVLELWAKAVEQHNNSEMVKAVAAEMLVILDPDKYYRQLVPAKVDGKCIFFVNSICDPHGDDWKQELILVKDGGSCYFQMKINLTKKETYEFTINGNG
jgi:hypothetical protein